MYVALLGDKLKHKYKTDASSRVTAVNRNMRGYGGVCICPTPSDTLEEKGCTTEEISE